MNPAETNPGSVGATIRHGNKRKNFVTLVVLGMKVSPKGKLTMRSMNVYGSFPKEIANITIVRRRRIISKIARLFGSRR